MNLQLLIDNPEIAKMVRIEITFSDLLLFANTLIAQSKNDAIKEYELSKHERYLTQTETCETLQVCTATLWHWKKKNYLVPAKIGGKVRYKYSDIAKLIENNSK